MAVVAAVQQKQDDKCQAQTTVQDTLKRIEQESYNESDMENEFLSSDYFHINTLIRNDKINVNQCLI